MRRAAVSVPLNLGAGQGRGNLKLEPPRSDEVLIL